jgi:hypothetical protein
VGEGFCSRHNSSAEISQQEFGFDRETVPDLTAEDRDGTESLHLETEEVGRDYGQIGSIMIRGQVTYAERNIEARSYNRCYSAK